MQRTCSPIVAAVPLLHPSAPRSDAQAHVTPFYRNRPVIRPSISSVHFVKPELKALQKADAPDVPAEEPPLSGAPQYDLVVLYPNDHRRHSAAEANARRRAIAARCRFVGLEVVLALSRDGDEVLMKLSAPDELLEEMAEQLTMEKRLKVGGYIDFTRERKKLFQPASAEQFFSSLERSRLMCALLELGLEEGGCGVDIAAEIRSGVLLAVVPMHELAVSEGRLLRRWALAPFRPLPLQPLDEVRDYFGEQSACHARPLATPSLLPRRGGPARGTRRANPRRLPVSRAPPRRK